MHTSLPPTHPNLSSHTSRVVTPVAGVELHLPPRVRHVDRRLSPSAKRDADGALIVAELGLVREEGACLRSQPGVSPCANSGRRVGGHHCFYSNRRRVLPAATDATTTEAAQCEWDPAGLRRKNRRDRRDVHQRRSCCAGCDHRRDYLLLHPGSPRHSRLRGLGLHRKGNSGRSRSTI